MQAILTPWSGEAEIYWNTVQHSKWNPIVLNYLNFYLSVCVSPFMPEETDLDVVRELCLAEK